MRRLERGDRKQRKNGAVWVEAIEIDPQCRDDIPAIMRGLKAHCCHDESRERLFGLLEEHLERSGIATCSRAARHGVVDDDRSGDAEGRPELRL